MIRIGYALPLVTAATLASSPMQGSAAMPDLFAALPATVADLDAYRWENRPVLIFAASADDPDYRTQRDALEGAAEGLRDRAIVVLSDTRPGDGGALRRRLGPRGFELLLFGKDGGLKLRETRPVSAEALFATIDAMPMRRREMSD